MEKFNLEELAGRLKRFGARTADALRELMAETDSRGADVPDGPLSARKRLEALFDEGTFTETGIFVRRRASEFDEAVPNEFESVITGWGAVNGRLVYAFSQDIGRTHGAVSEAHAKKICDIYKMALENGAPVVGIFDSHGAFLGEGVRALAGYGRIMKCVSDASGIIPQIAVAPGYAAGASAVIAGMFDILVSTENGSVSVNPASVTGGYDMGVCGVSALTAKNDGEAMLAVRSILGYLPSNNSEGIPEGISKDVAGRASELSAYAGSGDAHDMISAIADDGKFIEFFAAYAPEVTTGIISLGGTAAGVVATNKAVGEGTLTSVGARKAARMVSLLDSFNLPIITVVDSSGFSKSDESEKAPFGAELAKLAHSYAAATSPMVTLIAGEAYGTVFTVMGSKAIGADVVYALDSAKIASMNAKTAVAFLQNDNIGGNVTREDLEKQWNDTVATPVEAAASGEIDDIISSDEVRARLTSAVYMLSQKSALPASRRHLNMPL